MISNLTRESERNAEIQSHSKLASEGIWQGCGNSKALAARLTSNTIDRGTFKIPGAGVPCVAAGPVDDMRFSFPSLEGRKRESHVINRSRSHTGHTRTGYFEGAAVNRVGC